MTPPKCTSCGAVLLPVHGVEMCVVRTCSAYAREVVVVGTPGAPAYQNGWRPA